MKYHTQNVWTRRPSIMINMSEDEVQQLKAGLEALKELHIQHPTTLDPSQEAALNQLRLTLEAAIATPRPNGISGPGRYR